MITSTLASGDNLYRTHASCTDLRGQGKHSPTPRQVTFQFSTTTPVSPGRSSSGAAQGFEIVTLNVSGMRYQTLRSTIDKYPLTLLGNSDRRIHYYNRQKKEYFFNRHRWAFESILYYYQSDGRLLRPSFISTETFLKEIKFFDLGQEVINEFLKNEGLEFPNDGPMPKNVIAKSLWKLFECPTSSIFAKIVAAFSMMTILISVSNFILETLPKFDKKCAGTESKPPPKLNWDCPFFAVEFSCIMWFTTEFTIRFVCCPEKFKFCKKFLNIIDFLAIFPFYLKFFLPSGGASFAILRILRVLRVFRIFKVSRYSQGLQILGKTLSSSTEELLNYVFTLSLAGLLFASAVYFAEVMQPKSQFTSIPASFWYAIVSMTTVGYGDLVPETLIGKLLGSFCIIGGVLIMSMPVVVVVDNFQYFYSQSSRLNEIREHIDDPSEEKMEQQSPSQNHPPNSNNQNHQTDSSSPGSERGYCEIN